jgi:phosphate transport system substrate-binding protein
VVRSDGSGTTATFTDSLNKVDARRTKANGGPGTGSTVKWPAASTTTRNGNPGVASTVQQTPYAVGYVGSDWALSDQLTGSATNQHGADSYPITAVSWIVVHQHQSDMGKARALVAFVHYVLHEGQAINAPNQHAPMPASLVTKADAILAKVDVDGQAVTS